MYRRGFGFLGLLVLLLLCACGPKWMVVRQAVPNPLVGKRQFSCQPVEFTGLRVGGGTEEEHLADKNQKQRSMWEADKEALAGNFIGRLIAEAAAKGIKVTQGAEAPFLIRPKVTFIEPGHFGFWNIASRVEMSVTIARQDGTNIDEILLRHSTGAGISTASSGQRLRRDGTGLGVLTARYLEHRVLGRQ